MISKFENMINICSQGICIISDNLIVYANPAFEAMFGYTMNELNTIEPSLLVHPDDRKRLLDYRVDRMLDLNTPTKYDYKGITSSGDIRYIRCFANKINWDGHDACQLYNIDLTDEKATHDEQALMLEIVNENVQIGLWRIDSDNNLVYANQTFCRILENDFAHLSGKQYNNYFSKIDAQYLVSSKKQCNEIELQLGDGIRKWVKISSNPSPVGGTVGTLFDINKTKVVLPELIKLRDELKRERVQ